MSGVANVAMASPELRMRTFFEEGFGVLGGAVGTTMGASLGFGIVTILACGPVGWFVVIFICASFGGIIGMNSFKKIGSGIYDYGMPEGNGMIHHSPEPLLLEGLK